MVKVGEVVFVTVFDMMGNVLISRDFINLGEDSVDGGMKGLLRTIMQVAATPNLPEFNLKMVLINGLKMILW